MSFSAFNIIFNKGLAERSFEKAAAHILPNPVVKKQNLQPRESNISTTSQIISQSYDCLNNMMYTIFYNKQMYYYVIVTIVTDC